MAAESFRWCPIKAGQPIPKDAVKASDHGCWEDKMWVGMLDGQIGKITAKGVQGTPYMNCMRHHSDGTMWGHTDAAVLCCAENARWVRIQRGQPMPPNAVKGGYTKSDGVTYVGRTVGGEEPGKINATDDGNMWNLWVYSKYWSGYPEGEVLVVEANSQPAPTSASSQAPVMATATPVVATATAVAAVAAPMEPVPVPEFQQESMPAVPANFPEMKNLPLTELKFMEANPSAVDDFLHGLPAVKKCSERAEQLRREQQELAQEVLNKETRLDCAKSRYDRSVDVLGQCQQTMQSLVAKRDLIVQSQSAQHMERTLQDRAHNSDMLADDRLQHIVAGSGALDARGIAEFRRQYIEQKKDKHMHLALQARLTRNPQLL